jgi:hypothetical protein
MSMASLVVAIGGLLLATWYFRHVEGTFADVI